MDQPIFPVSEIYQHEQSLLEPHADVGQWDAVIAQAMTG